MCSRCLDTTMDFLKPYLAHGTWVHKVSQTTSENQLITSDPHQSKRAKLNPEEEDQKAPSGCKREEAIRRLAGAEQSKTHDMMLLHRWRQEVCRCERCAGLYKARGVEFLFEEEDNDTEVHELLDYAEDLTGSKTSSSAAVPADKQLSGAEETKAKTETAASQPPAAEGTGVLDTLCRIGMERMPRDRQYHIADGFRRLANGFEEYFRDFGRDGRVVTAEDIEKFFEKLQSAGKR